MTRDDAALVEAARSGDSAAFEALYQRYFGPLYDFAARTMKDQNAAADAVQDAFIKAHERLDQLRDTSAFRPWMYSIVRRETVSWFRSRSREDVVATIDEDDATRINPLLALQDDDVSTNPVSAAELEDSAALVWEAAASLDPDTYTVLDLHVRQGLTSSEIAEVLDITKGSAYTRLNRTKERAASAIGTYLLVRKGADDCERLSAIVATEDLPPVTPELRRTVDRHVRGCEICEERRRAMVAPMQIFAALAGVPPPPGLQALIWSNVGVAAAPARWRRPASIFAGVMIVALLGLGVGLVAGSADEQESTAAAPPETVTETTTSNPTVAATSSDTSTPPVDEPSPAESTESADDLPPAEDATPTDDPPPEDDADPPSTDTDTEPSTDTTIPDTTPPALGVPTVEPTAVYEEDSDVLSCPASYARTADVVVTVTDSESGVASVIASWATNAGTVSTPMSAAGSTYTAVVGPFPPGTAPDSSELEVGIVIVAADVEGNESKTSASLTLNSLGKCFG